MSSKEIGPREAALRAMRESKFREIIDASADVRRKASAAVKSAGVGEELIERIQKAALKRGKLGRKGKK
jgi:hypothetical protein